MGALAGIGADMPVGTDIEAIAVVLRSLQSECKMMLLARERLTSSHLEMLSAPVIKCKKTPRKKCSFMAERRKKR